MLSSTHTRRAEGRGVVEAASGKRECHHMRHICASARQPDALRIEPKFARFVPSIQWVPSKLTKRTQWRHLHGEPVFNRMAFRISRFASHRKQTQPGRKFAAIPNRINRFTSKKRNEPNPPGIFAILQSRSIAFGRTDETNPTRAGFRDGVCPIQPADR